MKKKPFAGILVDLIIVCYRVVSSPFAQVSLSYLLVAEPYLLVGCSWVVPRLPL
jgi:hypothetical protein